MKLPTWKQSVELAKRGMSTPLEQFIIDFEPVAPEDDLFRRSLSKAIDAELIRPHTELKKAEALVRDLVLRLNRACIIGIEAQLNSENERDELNDYLDFIGENNLLEW